MRQDVKDVLLAIGLLLFFLLTYFYIIPMGIYVPSNIRLRVMAPDFFPKTVSLFLIFMSLVLAFQTLVLMRKRRHGSILAKPPESERSASDAEIGWIPVVKVLSAILMLFLYYLAVVWIGILAASILFLLIFSILYGERRFKFTLPLAVGLSVIIYLFFTKVAMIPLPNGILFD
jgi:hypothetical protein